MKETIEQLRLLRKAGRRLRTVVKQANEHIRLMARDGDDLELLIAFCWYCQVMAMWISFCAVCDEVFEDDGEMHLSAIANNIGLIYLLEENECIHTFLMKLRKSNKFYNKKGNELVRSLSKSKPYNATALKNNMPMIIKIRNAYKISEQDYGIEAPQFGCKCHTENGEIVIKSEKDKTCSIHDIILDVGSRLLIGYRELIDRMTPIVLQKQWQEAFDNNCHIVNSVFNYECERKVS